MEFYESCKVLVSTDTSYKDGLPHMLLTGIDSCTQNQSVSIEFDHKKIFEREDRYHDVFGFYHTHPPELDSISDVDIDTMKQWVKCLGKNLMCVIETDNNINGWLFVKEKNGIISIKETKVSSPNDVNYDIWFGDQGAFWNPTDFLLDGEYFEPEEENTKEILFAVSEIKQRQENLTQAFGVLTDTIKKVINLMTEENTGNLQ